MNLANKLCYPSDVLNPDRVGLTFRERLIIALAGNPNLVMKYQDKGETYYPHIVDTAANIIQQADAIIKQLEQV